MHGRPDEKPTTADWERFAKTMGLRGEPAYQVKDVKAGQVKSTRFCLELSPADSGFAGTITHADLPIRLPVFVEGMNPNWTFAWFDLDRKQWQPSAVDRQAGRGYFTIETRRGQHSIFAGHPVIADNPDVRIAVLSDGKGVVDAWVNNVSDEQVKVKLRLNPALGQAEPQEIDLASGEMKKVSFAFSGP
jgi:hypothetical protein